MQPSTRIDLSTPLRLRSAFLFPLQSSLSRREVLIGAMWLFVPFVGWIMNMGHRIAMTHRMQHGQPAWPAWQDHPSLFTSVWFWQVAGFSFATVFTKEFGLRSTEKA